ncbi:MAG: hypothetical protein K2W97_03180 [Chthoniobacterales bacterium]|nr:hypothetical protein [Chthoniobacterales bacterium]
MPLGTNIDSNITPSGSEDRFNAASFLQESNPPDADQHWTLGGKIGVVILGVAALAVIIKRCQYSHDSRKNTNKAGNQSHLRDSTALGDRKGEAENPVSRVQCNSPDTVTSNASQLLPDKGKTSIIAILTVDDIKNQLLELDKLRKEREEQDNAISTANRTSGWVFFPQYWFAQKQSEGIKSEDQIDDQLEIKIRKLRADLGPNSSLEQMTVPFVGAAKENLEKILRSIPDENSKSDDIEQRKFVFFAARHNFSEGHLNGYLEALEKKDDRQEILDQIKELADEYWKAGERASLVANEVNNYLVLAEIPSSACSVAVGKDKRGHGNQNGMGVNALGSEQEERSAMEIGHHYTIINGDDHFDEGENSTSGQNKLPESKKGFLPFFSYGSGKK